MPLLCRACRCWVFGCPVALPGARGHPPAPPAFVEEESCVEEKSSVRSSIHAQATTYLNKLPAKLAKEDLFLIADPMLATGGTIVQVGWIGSACPRAGSDLGVACMASHPAGLHGAWARPRRRGMGQPGSFPCLARRHRRPRASFARGIRQRYAAMLSCRPDPAPAAAAMRMPAAQPVIEDTLMRHAWSQTYAFTTQVIEDIVARGGAAENVRIVAVVVAPPALKKLADKFPGLKVITRHASAGSGLGQQAPSSGPEGLCRTPDRDACSCSADSPACARGHMPAARISRLRERSSTRKVAARTACQAHVATGGRRFYAAQVYTAMIDETVNEKGYIVPGLGDAGDRAFGTPH